MNRLPFRTLLTLSCIRLPRPRHPILHNKRHPFCTLPSIPRFHDSNLLSAKAQALLVQLESQRSPDDSKLSETISLATQASDQGSPRAKTILASMHREGVGLPQDKPLAEQLFRQAAEAGDPIAQCSLGVLILDRIRESAEEEPGVSSEKLYIDIDEEGKPHARVDLQLKDGSLISDAPKPADLVRRVRKARRKAGFTDQEAWEFEEFKTRERERGREEERAAAFAWLEKAIEQGNDHAMVSFANELLEKQPLRAVELYKQAVKEGKNTDAYYNLGQIYTMGVEGIDVDHKAASINFAMAAQLGDASAQYYLGHLYRVGSDFVKVDEASSLQYVQLAADQEHPAATFYLALMHKNGEGGLEASNGAFLRYVTKAAKLEHGPAHICLGEMYYKGTDGVSVDYEKALYHFNEGGKLGEAEAYCSAAAMYFHGFGTAKDEHQAFLLYQEAARFGSISALRNIGSMYFEGQGVPPNKKVSEQFFKIADEYEAKQRQEGLAFTRNTPVRTAEAPKHPMADIPRSTSDFSEAAIEDPKSEEEPEGEPEEGRRNG